MITYKRGRLHIIAKVFQCTGSVFPSAFCIALPCAVVTALVKILIDDGPLEHLSRDGENSILKDNACWSGFTFLVGFLIVFRTSQAYNRFWEGCSSTHTMRAEWFDACSALCAFCKYAKADMEAVLRFQHLLIRLFSMLHAVALADIEDCNSDESEEVQAFGYELVDAQGLDVDSLNAIKQSDAKVELTFQWIQQLIVENIDNGVLHIPPPILSRAFQEIANGMVAFHEAIKISTIPFPFPYAQTCECLLLMHWLVAPVVISHWVSTAWWGALFSFLQVFVYWSLNAIAVELENPFGKDANDIDAGKMQDEMNRHLLLLLEPQTKKTPTLAGGVATCLASEETCWAVTAKGRQSLCEIWPQIEAEGMSNEPPVRSSRRMWTSGRDTGGGLAEMSPDWIRQVSAGSHLREVPEEQEQQDTTCENGNTASCKHRPKHNVCVGRILGTPSDFQLAPVRRSTRRLGTGNSVGSSCSVASEPPCGAPPQRLAGTARGGGSGSSPPPTPPRLQDGIEGACTSRRSSCSAVHVVKDPTEQIDIECAAGASADAAPSTNGVDSSLPAKAVVPLQPPLLASAPFRRASSFRRPTYEPPKG